MVLAPDVYGDWQEYQRMAVLTALKEIRSPLLGEISKTSKRGWTNLSCPVRGRDFFRNTKDAGGIKTLYRHMLFLSFEICTCEYTCPMANIVFMEVPDNAKPREAAAPGTGAVIA